MASYQVLVLLLISYFCSFANGTILQNGQVRQTNFPDTVVTARDFSWKTYPANATQLSYKGRWDSKYISWWSAPGLKFGFTGDQVAITFGNYTSNGVLIAYRVDGLDWQMTNITTNATHLLVSPTIYAGIDTSKPSTFELRVTNWAYGVQINAIHVAAKSTLIKIPNFPRSLEVIGDSLSAGDFATYESLASFAYGLGAGLGNTEYSITGYPGICLHDQNCWGNPRGQTYQWYQTSDTSARSREFYGVEPEKWDFSKQQKADLVVICLGTNDNNTANNVGVEKYYKSYLKLVEGVHGVWPDAKIVLMSLWNGFYQSGTTYKEAGAFKDEIFNVYKHFNSPSYLSTAEKCRPGGHHCNSGPQRPFVYYFNTTGILQHNDIAPQWHPTDVGHIKLASHLMQYVKQTFGWEFEATGPEIQHETLYWNDQDSY